MALDFIAFVLLAAALIAGGINPMLWLILSCFLCLRIGHAAFTSIKKADGATTAKKH